MKKSVINKYCRKFGFEVHGSGYMQSLQKAFFKEDAFEKQQEIAGTSASTIFDIGANTGEVTLQYAGLFPKAIIYAFEPFETTFSILSSKTGSNSKIKIFQKAIADLEGKKSFFINHNADTNSLLKPKTMGLNSDKEVLNKGNVIVDVTTVDNFCSENKISKIDILKLDIQGGELAALKGAERMLKEGRVNLIYTEAYFKQQYEDQPLFHDISKYLEQYGYALQDIYNPIYGKGSLVWCDAVFLKAK